MYRIVTVRLSYKRTVPPRALSSCPRCHSLRRNRQCSRRHHASHRVRHSACLMQARARRSPCANRTRCPGIRATQAFVVCVTIRPFGGSGPLGSGPSPCAGLAAGLCLGVAPYPVSQATSRAGATGGDQGPGTKKQRADARRFLAPALFFPPTFSRSCPLAGSAQMIPQCHRIKDSRLATLPTSINLFYKIRVHPQNPWFHLFVKIRVHSRLT
jgi:hypothetical protein